MISLPNALVVILSRKVTLHESSVAAMVIANMRDKLEARCSGQLQLNC